VSARAGGLDGTWLRRWAPLLHALIACAALAAWPAPSSATTLPPGFQESTQPWTGLDTPIAIEFAPNGRVFVAEKSGVIKTYDSASDTTPTQFADLRTQVHNYWDRGLLGLAVDPNFPAEPYVYVFYVHDAMPGGTAPTWGLPGQTTDTCPDPPGGTGDGTVDYLRDHLGENLASASLVIEGTSSVLARTGDDIVDLVRRGQGVLNIVPLAGLVQSLDASIHDLGPEETRRAGRARR